MKEQLAKIRAEAISALESAKDAADLDALRVKYLRSEERRVGKEC